MAILTHNIMVESEIWKNIHGEFQTVVYWNEDCFLDAPPYRKIVKWIIQELRARHKVDVVEEPEEEQGEDFIVHQLQVDGKRMDIYWENSLGLIAFISPDSDLIRELSKYLCGRKPEI